MFDYGIRKGLKLGNPRALQGVLEETPSEASLGRTGNEPLEHKGDLLCAIGYETVCMNGSWPCAMPLIGASTMPLSAVADE